LSVDSCRAWQRQIHACIAFRHEHSYTIVLSQAAKKNEKYNNAELAV
jgi:hypothetical protein